jgi:RHS repeat-associated protein
MPLCVEDHEGNVVWWVNRVDPYGLLELRDPQQIDYSRPGSAIELNLRWPGHYFDAETGLHYNRHRYYDPSLGRYLQPDPLGYAGSPTNLYAYCQNPTTGVDVFGLKHDAKAPLHSDEGTDTINGRERTWRKAEAGEKSPLSGKPVKDAHKVVEYKNEKGEVVARYYLDDKGRTVRAEGRMDPPEDYTKEGAPRKKPEGFIDGEDHRGHLIPERSTEDQKTANVPENIIPEHGTKSNLSEKKKWENDVRDQADEKPGRWTSHEPQYDGDDPRPTSVTHDMHEPPPNSKPVPGMNKNIPNPKS